MLKTTKNVSVEGCGGTNPIFWRNLPCAKTVQGTPLQGFQKSSLTLKLRDLKPADRQTDVLRETKAEQQEQGCRYMGLGF